MRRLFGSIAGAVLLVWAGAAGATEAAAAAPQMAGWFERTIGQLEAEATSDVSMAPDVWSALGREWRSFDRNGSASGVILDIGWVAAATIVALLAEGLAARLAALRPRRRMASRADGPRLYDLFATDRRRPDRTGAFLRRLQRRPAACHAGSRDNGGTVDFFAANVLIRWRVVAVVIGAILRPHDPAARLIENLRRRGAAAQPLSVGHHPHDHFARRLWPLWADGRG